TVSGKPAANFVAVRESMRVSEKTWRSMVKPVTELNPLVPEPLAELVHRCLEFHPANRPERMTEVRDALRKIAEDLGEAVGRGTENPPQTQPTPHNPAPPAADPPAGPFPPTATPPPRPAPAS